MRKIVLLFVVLCQCVFAQSFDFNSSGEESANTVLKDFVKNEFYLEDADTIAFKYNSYIIGIVKSNIFYNLEGYKLIILNGDNKPLKCDIFFDNTREIIFDNNKITYYKSVFYKNKKYSAYIRNNEIKTYKTLNDKLTDRKVQNIEQLTKHSSNPNTNIVELSDFKASPQRNVNVKYNNLSEKMKHYLDMN